MSDIAEKRVFDSRSGELSVYLATDLGVVRVSVSDDRIGRFGVDRRGDAHDVIAWDGRLAVAAGDVLLRDDDGYVPLGFGPAVALGLDGDDLLAVDRSGRIASRSTDGDDWSTLGRVGASVRDLDGDLVAAADGVHRIDRRRGRIDHVGLDDATAVSTTGVPLAATTTGLYRLGNGWMRSLSGAFRTVAVDRRSDPGTIAGAFAAGESGLFAHADGEWAPVGTPTDSPIVALEVASSASGTVYAVTDDGALLLRTADGLEPAGAGTDGRARWAVQELGVPGVVAIAVPGLTR